MKRPADLSSVRPTVLQFANSSPYELFLKKKKIDSPYCQILFSFTFGNAWINTAQHHAGCFKTLLFSYLYDMKWSVVELPRHCTARHIPPELHQGYNYRGQAHPCCPAGYTTYAGWTSCCYCEDKPCTMLKWLLHQGPKPCLESSGPEVSPSNEQPHCR